jgi:hypothetical protein
MDRKSCIAVLAMAGVAIGGCGGSKPLSRAELVKQANVICKEREAKVQAVLKTARELKAAERTLLPTMTDAVARLRALRPPESSRAQYTQFVALDAALVTGIRRNLAGQHADSAAESARGHKRYRLTQQLGLSECKG